MRSKTGSKFFDDSMRVEILWRNCDRRVRSTLAENTVEAGDTLASGILKILGIERSQVRCGAEMPGVYEHGVGAAERGAVSLWQSAGATRQNLVGLGEHGHRAACQGPHPS